MKNLKAILFLILFSLGLQSHAQIVDVGTLSCTLEGPESNETFDISASFKTDDKTVRLILMKLMAQKGHRNFPFVIRRIQRNGAISGHGHFIKSMAHEDRYKRERRSFSFGLDDQNLVLIMGQERLNCSHARKDYDSIQEVYQSVLETL